MKDKKDFSTSSFIRSLLGFLVFFGVISFIVTCCFLLFLDSIQMEVEELKFSARITFLNIIFLSLLFTIINKIAAKWTIDRPVKYIHKITKRLMSGDFTSKIEPLHSGKAVTAFDSIIIDLGKLSEELASVESLRNDFMSNVSHEIKTPLSVIQNCGTMLQSPDISDDDKNLYSQKIVYNCKQISSLITNILKLNKLENQQIFPKTEKYDLSEQITECVLSFEDLIETKNINLSTDIDDGILISANKDLLVLVWNNLLSNAIKFTESNGEISIAVKKINKEAIISISDTGCGISREIGSHIFEKFYQGDTSHATEGNGLGLALVKRIIDITGSEINVESEIGKGSTFTVCLKI